MQFVKVLDKDLCPLIQGGEPYKVGVWNHCENFNMQDEECAPGFYVIPIRELIRYHRPLLETKVLPAEVGGRSKIFSPAKQRYEYMKLGNPLSDEEIKKLCKEIEPKLGYKLSEALYSVNPLLLPKAVVTDADIKLLRQWDSDRNNVTSSVWAVVADNVINSVGASTWKSVKNIVRENVWDSIRENAQDSAISSWDALFAYIGGLFHKIEKWKYIDHKSGAYPFQSVVDLWYRGLLPVFRGRKWRLLSGEKAEVVWTEPKVGWLKAQEEHND
jgi:hypothetical protein